MSMLASRQDSQGFVRTLISALIIKLFVLAVLAGWWFAGSPGMTAIHGVRDRLRGGNAPIGEKDQPGPGRRAQGPGRETTTAKDEPASLAEAKDLIEGELNQTNQSIAESQEDIEFLRGQRAELRQKLEKRGFDSPREAGKSQRGRGFLEEAEQIGAGLVNEKERLALYEQTRTQLKRRLRRIKRQIRLDRPEGMKALARQGDAGRVVVERQSEKNGAAKLTPQQKASAREAVFDFKEETTESPLRSGDSHSRRIRPETPSQSLAWQWNLDRTDAIVMTRNRGPLRIARVVSSDNSKKVRHYVYSAAAWRDTGTLDPQWRKQTQPLPSNLPIRGELPSSGSEGRWVIAIRPSVVARLEQALKKIQAGGAQLQVHVSRNADKVIFELRQGQSRLKRIVADTPYGAAR